jgi:hypothetical protein
MESDIRELTAEIITWRKTILKDPHPTMMLSKLIEELEELKEHPCDGHEMADIMIIFLDYCDTVGVDIVKAVHYKMEINKEREWELDNDGKLQHKRSIESEPRPALAYCRYCEATIPGGTPMECLHDIDQPCIIDGPK